MKMNLFFHHYASKHIKSEDYFADIRAEIGFGYDYSYDESGTIYMPVELADLEDAKQRGLLLMPRTSHEIPHYAIREMIVTFKGLGRDFEVDMEHLVANFGSKAFKCVVFEEFLLPLRQGKDKP